VDIRSYWQAETIGAVDRGSYRLACLALESPDEAKQAAMGWKLNQGLGKAAFAATSA
jgi:hypothetical protein